MEGRQGPTFSISTLGCKLNQYESECIRQALVGRGWEFRPFGEDADYYVINTCTVTGKTDSRCRNAVRRARKAAPEATIVVTGCYAETQAESLEKILVGLHHNFLFLLSQQSDISHTLEPDQLVTKVGFCHFAELIQIIYLRMRKGEYHHRLGIGIDLCDCQLIDIFILLEIYQGLL